jgi:peroxiredoxin
VQVVPILAQSSEAVRHYIEETGLPFDILIDEKRVVVKAYGVWDAIGVTAWNIAKPAVFLIDRSGAIHYSYIANRQDQFPSHDEVMGAIGRLKA